MVYKWCERYLFWISCFVPFGGFTDDDARAADQGTHELFTVGTPRWIGHNSSSITSGEEISGQSSNVGLYLFRTSFPHPFSFLLVDKMCKVWSLLWLQVVLRVLVIICTSTAQLLELYTAELWGQLYNLSPCPFYWFSPDDECIQLCSSESP